MHFRPPASRGLSGWVVGVLSIVRVSVFLLKERKTRPSVWSLLIILSIDDGTSGEEYRGGRACLRSRVVGHVAAQSAWMSVVPSAPLGMETVLWPYV